MEIAEKADSELDLEKLKEIKEIQDIKPELTPELVDLSEWYGKYHVTKRISILEAMLPSAIKAKYTKVFEMVEDELIPEDLLKKFDREGHYAYKAAQQNGDLDRLVPLMEEDAVREVTLLSQNTKKKTQRAIRISPEHNPDDVLAMLENILNNMMCMSIY